MLRAVRAVLVFGGRRQASTVARTSAGVVNLQYKDLVAGADLSEAIKTAYGPEGLGILVVSGVPGFAEKRKRLLPLARRLAELPAAELQKLEDAKSRYSFGWSHGKEKFNGVPDVAKGSFYANPQYNRASEDPELAARLPEYCGENLWPRAALPQLESAFRDLGGLIVSVGALVAQQCDAYVASQLPSYRPRLLTNIIMSSLACKARLLHYFPLTEAQAKQAAQDSWCGWHLDHGSLTGLTPAMFLNERLEEVPCPDPLAGLYIRDRAGREHRVTMEPGQIGFQIGESSQIHTGGLLMATPHCVRAAGTAGSGKISRETLAVFMQPTWDVPMTPPAGVDPNKIGVTGWAPGQDFNAFANAKFSEYY